MTSAGVRIVQKLSSMGAFAKVAPHVVPATDRAVHRLTRGRVLLSALMLPGVVLTSTGARSGLPRRTPLACMPERSGRWIVVGSNFGRSGHPAWTADLLVRPDAEISWKGEAVPVTARLLEGRERAAGRRSWPSGPRTRRTRSVWSGRSGCSGSCGGDQAVDAAPIAGPAGDRPGGGPVRGRRVAQIVARRSTSRNAPIPSIAAPLVRVTARVAEG